MMLPNNGRSDTQQSFKKKQSKPQQETKSKQFLQLPTGTALPNQHKRNSFHGYASSSSDFYSPSQSTLIVSMMNGSNSYGSSLLQNGHNWSAVGSQEPLASLTLSGTSLASSKMRSKCSLNLRLEDGGNMETSSINNNNNHHMSSSNMTSSNNHQIQHQTAAMARTAKALHQQQARQHGSTDSAPAAAVNGERKKRMELWALAPSSAFHQSIDMRTSADVSALSNSCGHIVAAEAAPTASRTSSTNNAATTVAAIDVAASSGYHSERRSAICPGDTSRDHGRHHGSCRGGGGISSQLLLFCTASGCSGHAPCIGHQPPALRSTQSSIDDSTGESGLTGQLRDTYLTEISREWMRMNGAIAPFRNILQPASSVASTPLPNHRPMIQSPAAPATTTATAILKGKATAEEEFGGGGYTVEAIQGSCHNLATVTAATTTEQRIVDQFVRPRPKDCGIANDVAAGNGSGDAIIINEPQTMSQKRYGRRTPSGPLESLDKIFPNSIWHNQMTPSANCTPCSSTATTASSSSSGSCTVSFPRSRLRHGYCVNQQHQIGVPPSLPAVVLLPEGSLNGGMFSSTVGVESSGHRLVRDMSMDVQSPGMECSSGGSCFGGQLQRPQSRSPSASSLNAYSSRHSSPNPSPPLTGQHQQKVMSPRSPSNIGGAASVARMMSALLKQQNSIAEEEDSLLLVEDDDAADVEIGQAATNASSLEARLNCPNGMPSHIGTPPIVGAVDQPKNWLAPPLDFVLLGGSISPPPVRMHPVTDHEPRREFHSHDGGLQLADPAAARSVLPCTSSQMGTVTESAVKQHKYHHNHHRHHHHPGTNEEKFHRQQSQPTWTRGIGANSKHRKGSLSPNNSLRYSTLMAAARRNHFQQQRTTSEATPAQRDLLMADVLGHGIRDKFCCASISAPSPQLSQECNEGGGDSIVSSSKVLARFEVGAGDSSASSLNNHGSSSANATPCSQCSSTNSLLHFQHCCVGSIKHKQHQQAAQRSCTATGDSGGKAESGSGSLPKLVALVPSAFPPSSVMLSSNSNELLANTNSSGGGGTSQQSSIAGVGTKKRRKSRANTSTQQQQQQHQQTPVGKQCQDQTQPANLLLCPPDQQRYMSGNSDAIATGSSSESGAAAVLRRDPARWNLAATKQRSSSETTFINMVSSTHVADDAPSVVAQHQCSCCNMCKSTSADGSHRCVHVPYVHVEPVPSGFTAVRAVSLGMASAGAPPSSGDRTVSGGKPHCPLAHACNGTLRRPDSLSALGRSGYKHCAAIAMLNNNSVFMQNNAQREQAILQRILGPTGLGWLKQQRRLESDPLLKKSLSLVLTDDVEAQRTGAVSAAPGGTASGGNAPSEKGGAHGSLLNNDGVSACSAKQSLVKDKERGGRFIKRQQLFSKRRVTSDYALFFAIFGIVLMIIENEFVYAEFTSVCVLLKLVILLSTICLVGLVVKFHVHEIQIFMNANSAEDWQIALTCRKSMQIVVEIIACAICPLPIKLDVFVSTVNSDGHTVPMRMPLDVLFSILMFFRLYWLCRVMLLHSRLFTDAASRSIAGLNRVKTDAKFILKTLMTICPGTMLLLFTASLWMIGGYILRLCERHHEQHDDASLLHNNMQANKHQSYLNSLWLIAVTFLSIGYGDIVPNTQCGRIMAVVTGILGTCTSSMVVAVIARKLELTRAEKHVHNFMIETQHTKQLKHIAANVLRETWLIYKHRCLVDKIEPRKIRHHQRKFLVAICALRKLKTSQRKLDENRISLGDVAKTTSHSHDLMREVHSTQEGLALRITAVEHQLSDIQREVGSIADMLRCALRPSPGPVDQQQMMELCPVRQRRKPSMIGDA